MTKLNDDTSKTGIWNHLIRTWKKDPKLAVIKALSLVIVVACFCGAIWLGVKTYQSISDHGVHVEKVK